MKKFLLLQFAFLISGFIHAQTEKVSSVSITEVGPALEMPISKKMTAKVQIGVLPNIDYELEDSLYLSITFRGYVNGSIRHYYNFEKRKSKGKNIERNSGNYFGFSNHFISSPLLTIGEADLCECLNNFFVSGFVWGMQRNYNPLISLDLNSGLGYNFKSNALAPILNVTVGIWFSSKK